MEKNNVLSQEKQDENIEIIEPLSTEETLQSMVETIDILRKEHGDQDVSNEVRNALIEELGVDKDVAKGWKKITDILDMIDTHELAKNHPEIMGKMARKIGSLVGIFYGPVGIVAQKIPDNVAGKVVEFAGLLAPEHILNVVAKDQLNRAREKRMKELLILKEQFETTANQKLLVVVYEDEVLLNRIHELVETNDDTEDEIVGTEDNTIKIVPWTKETWKNNRRDRRLEKAKILFIGTSEGTENLISETDKRFEKFGVFYAWSGNRAIINADTKALKDKNYYEKFIQDLRSLPLPENAKNAKKMEGKTKTLATVAATLLLGPIGTAGSLIGIHIKDEKTLLQQMLLYGIINLYNNDLEAFINS
ncbi:MAG: hypothetical protein J6B54_00165 [Clostridia bacterium]|nr:hypothetical protein [Clostridia bacterium]